MIRRSSRYTRTGTRLPYITLFRSRAATGDPVLVCDVAALNPESRCCAGEFSLVPAHNDAKLFDIDAHPWGAEAGELECRLARTMIDATLHPVPAGFLAALGILPPATEPGLAIRVSGYTCCTFVLLNPQYMATSRPRPPRAGNYRKACGRES